MAESKLLNRLSEDFLECQICLQPYRRPKQGYLSVLLRAVPQGPLNEYFADTAVKAKEDIIALLAKTEKKMGDLKNADQQAHSQKTELEKNVTETVEKIKKKAEQTKKHKEFSSAIEEIETATVALESAAEFGRNIVEHGSEFDIMAVSGEVNGRLRDLLEVELADITDKLPKKAYIAFEEDKTSDMTKPRLGEVKTTQGFRTARFTTLGTTGRQGPTSLGTHYRGQDHEELVQLKDGIHTARNGLGVNDPKSARGRGAVVRGAFQLKKGEVLKILAGQGGLENKSSYSVGGGGGTFVTKTDNTPLIVAGGAGGGNGLSKRNPNSDGTTATAGQSSSGGITYFTGGSDGKGATQGSDGSVGGGGGGLLTDGASGKNNFGGTDGNNGGEGGKAFVNGGVGGRGVKNNAEGGFGGGGGSLGAGGGGGGGGGYSGGGRGGAYFGACGGGGGSYNSGSDTSGESGANDGPGVPRNSSKCAPGRILLNWIHSQETLKLYCIDCSESICQLCTVLSHKDHKYEYYADTAVKAKKDILALLAKTEKKLGDLMKADQQVNSQKTELEKKATKAFEKIKRKAGQTRRKFVALVNQQEAELLNCVNTVRKTRGKELFAAIEEIETATVALESAAEFGRNIVEHGSEFEIMSVSEEVNGRLKELLQVEIADITRELHEKAYVAFDEDETSDMAKPRLGEVKKKIFKATFTTLGTTGRLGPTSLGTHYRGQDHEEVVQLKDGIQYFTVPDTGKYRIEAAGSAAGWGVYDPKSARGRGAVVRGAFELKKGEVLKILVGQEGMENKSRCGVGGGGGTFVTKTDNTPLIVAGGAGGGNNLTKRNPNSDGTTATAGQSSSGGITYFTGGSDGKGATQGDNDNVGGGGGGFLTDGASGKNHFDGTDGNTGGEGGNAFVNGGVGGRGVFYNAEGGFGGGGGSLGAGGGGGGGGGYSGGGRAGGYIGDCGGGGGSYNSGSDTSGFGMGMGKGTTATAGQSSSGGLPNFSGGSDGKEATQGYDSNVGGGGGGLLTDGASGKVYFGGTDGSNVGEGGKAFVKGAVGVRGVNYNAEGGFGGGGGSYGHGERGGGGGGYSRGGRGDNWGGACGDGGGSYNSG
ncbi:keratin, type I cytoskeletal 9-like [Branchiostoma lanceolatum]|uniref:keratin, type I cytoskeletal 9-like n=1 Tax=Branchiostoma lanceolatum TaxID=7740 RepID=UPI003455E48A